MADLNPFHEYFLQRLRYQVGEDGIIRIKPDWEDLRYEVKLAFNAQLGLVDRAWAIVDDLVLCE